MRGCGKDRLRQDKAVGDNDGDIRFVRAENLGLRFVAQGSWRANRNAELFCR
jgi:hypothetical protein